MNQNKKVLQKIDIIEDWAILDNTKLKHKIVSIDNRMKELEGKINSIDSKLNNILQYLSENRQIYTQALDSIYQEEVKSQEGSSKIINDMLYPRAHNMFWRNQANMGNDKKNLVSLLSMSTHLKPLTKNWFCFIADELIFLNAISKGANPECYVTDYESIRNLL